MKKEDFGEWFKAVLTDMRANNPKRFKREQSDDFKKLFKALFLKHVDLSADFSKIKY
jgi:hypothetical protein